MQTTKDLLKKYYDAFNQQDIPSFLACLTDDVIHDLNQGERQIGKEAFLKFMTHMNHCYREKALEITIMVNEDGTRAAVELMIEGTYLVTDQGLPVAKQQTYRLPVGTFFSIKHNKISRVSNYYNLQDWLNQVSKT